MSERQRKPAQTYKEAGVDIAGGSIAKQRIGELVRRTHTSSVLGEFGHFGGLFRAPSHPGTVLVSSADSVGTKVLVAVLANRHEGIGVDLVNHSINDILCCGARPMFFLDYFACSNLDEHLLEDLVAGMSQACADAGCALIGGETAQLPGIYAPETYDLAGFMVGRVQENQIIDGSSICPGDVVLGLASNGLHTNGYSLARAVFGLDTSEPNAARERLDHTYPELGETLGDALLRPHRSYLPAVSNLLEGDLISGMAHVTGGGIAGNLERIIPDGCTAVLDTTTWTPPPIFDLIQQAGQVETDEMYRVFNMGIGFVIVARRDTGEMIQATLEEAIPIGEIAGSSASGERVRLT